MVNQSDQESVVLIPRNSSVASWRASELIEGFVRRRVSVIMPAFNEADRIAKSVEEVKSLFENVCEDLEIIVADDGSTDGTRRASKKILDKNVKLVSYERNQGKGYALKWGFQHATGEYTFFIDSDMEIHPKALNAYMEGLSDADLVIGSKRHPDSIVRSSIARKFLSLGFNLIERLLTGTKVTDTQAGLKSSRSAALYRILPLLSVKRYAFDAELLAVASLLGFKVKELPVEVDLKSSFSIRQVFRMLIDLLGIAYRLRIRRWYQKNILEMSDTYKPMIPW